MKKIIYFLILFLPICSCQNKVTDNGHASDTPLVNSLPRLNIDSIYYRTDITAKLAIKSNLSHNKGFACDSIVGVDYIGYKGEHDFMPLNSKGQFISSIVKSKKLTNDQFVRLNKILGNTKTYENPRIVSCYEPRLAFIYFKNNEVIGQTQICLSCAGLRSTAKTGNNQYGGLFNQKATDELDKFGVEIGLISK